MCWGTGRGLVGDVLTCRTQTMQSLCFKRLGKSVLLCSFLIQKCFSFGEGDFKVDWPPGPGFCVGAGNLSHKLSLEGELCRFTEKRVL